MLSRKYIEKIPSNYIGEKVDINRCHLITNLRLNNNTTLRELSIALKLSENTLRNIEKGKYKLSFYYYFLYCRHFKVDSYSFLNYSSLPTKTLKDKIETLKAYYGFRNNKQLDALLELYNGAIDDCCSKHINYEKINTKLTTRINEYKEGRK
ncbi:MAG: helix-turn-helix transcriptional regulator [Clostridium sp.]|uniref:helix-turn-helix domain-containing protein n=1 Tax=Clostridium sp. TaxID=1506 RepID=UPI00304FF0CA